MNIFKIFILVMVLVLAVSTIVILIRFISSQSKPSLSLGIKENGELQACPDSPNCVSSFAPVSDDVHNISAVKVNDEQEWNDLKTKIKNYFNSQKRYSLQQESVNYFYYTQKSALFGFVDDLEILFLPETKELHFRSSSRLGYSDMGVNRKRVEQIKEVLI
jgi:uncharacterized protein (DUF1499 family)